MRGVPPRGCPAGGCTSRFALGTAPASPKAASSSTRVKVAPPWFLRNLPQLPSDRLYQLWVIEGDQPPYPSEIFARSEPVTELSAELPIAADQVASLAVSIEPRGGSASPTGPIVALARPVPLGS